MPDLITHVAVSHLVKRPFELQRKGKSAVAFRTIFYFGTILPDILTRPFYILFPATYNWVIFFHTPAGIALTSALIAFLFESTIRRKVFINLIAGAGLHFFMDAFQKQVSGNNFWLFPFSWKDFGFGVAWPGEIMYFIPLWLTLVVFLEMWIYFRSKKRTNEQKN